MGVACTREGANRGTCSRLVGTLCARDRESRRGTHILAEDSPAGSGLRASPRTRTDALNPFAGGGASDATAVLHAHSAFGLMPTVAPVPTLTLSQLTGDDPLAVPASARPTTKEILAPSVRSREVPFTAGDEVVVRRDLGGGYGLRQGMTGKVIHIDTDGDALIDFPNQEEQWVHSTMFPKLEKVNDELPILAQVCHLLPAVCLSICGWNILVGVVEAAYWHLIDPHGAGIPLATRAAVFVLTASFWVVDCCNLQASLARYANVVAGLPPLLLALSAANDASFRCICLVGAAAAQGWAAIAILGCEPSSRRRTVHGWGILVALLAMPMLRWFLGSANPFLAVPSAKVALGCAGVASAAAAACQGGAGFRRPGAEGDGEDTSCQMRCDLVGWPAGLSAGLMGGSALALFLRYLTSLQQPSVSTYGNPHPLMSLWTGAALGVGTCTLAAVWSLTPWWLDTCQAALVLAAAPVLACGLQALSAEAVEPRGPIPGTGPWAHAGLLLLAALFPLMLALLGKELGLLSQSRAAGRAFLMVALFATADFLFFSAVLLGGQAPVGGPLLQGQAWPHVVGLGCLWCAGVLGAPNGAGRPSVHDSWYLSRHAGPPKREYMKGALTLIIWVLAVFLCGAVPLRVARNFVTGPADDSLLVVGGYNVQQGYTMDGLPNTDCVTDLLSDTNVDLVGLSASNAMHPLAGGNDPGLIYATRLKMSYIRGAPAALPTLDGAILSRLAVESQSTAVLEPVLQCEACPTQAHLWVRARVLWHDVPVDFHTLRLQPGGDPSAQIEYVAQQLRERFFEGPLVLVGDLGLPAGGTTRPRETALAELVRGTGLQEAFGALDSDVPLPLPPTTFVSGQHRDYIFYRGLELVGKWVHSRAPCSDHMLTMASFRKVAK